MHLKRMAMPRGWPLPRKGKKKFVTAGKGALPVKASLPLLVVLRDLLRVVATKAEAKKVLPAILVNGKPASDVRIRVGLFDQIYIKKIDKGFGLELERGKLKVRELERQELNRKLAKVIGKRSLKRGVIQINLHDGRNYVMSPEQAKNIAIGDSLILDLKENKIIKRLPLERGALALVIAGKHCGKKGRIVKIDKQIVLRDEKEFTTLKENVFIVER